MKIHNTAIVGLGRIGTIHLENLVKNISNVNVIAIMDIQGDLEDMAEEFKVPNTFTDFDKMLSIPALDSVIICSPTDTHADFVVKAAKAGKHIFCEKPLDLSLKTVMDVLREVEKCDVKLMLGFNRRFDPEFKKIRQLVLDGSIGDPHIVKITSRDPEPPPSEYVNSSGGIFLDMTIHDFDMARYIMGSQVSEVYAQGAVLIDPEIGEAGDVDTAIIVLTFADGKMAVIDNSRKAVYGYDQRLEVFGNKGMAQAGNNFPNNHKLYNETGVSGDLPLHFFLERYSTSYVEEMRAFIEALVNEKEMPIDGNDGLQSVAIGLAAKKSLEEGRPVRIDEVFSDL